MRNVLTFHSPQPIRWRSAARQQQHSVRGRRNYISNRLVVRWTHSAHSYYPVMIALFGHYLSCRWSLIRMKFMACDGHCCLQLHSFMMKETFGPLIDFRSFVIYLHYTPLWWFPLKVWTMRIWYQFPYRNQYQMLFASNKSLDDRERNENRLLFIHLMPVKICFIECKNG